MKIATAGITIALITSSLCSALPPTKKDRVHDLPLSDKEHRVNGEHNDDYDHDAFLGRDEADEFDQLSPEESKERLGKLVDKIDRDNDGYVTEEELIHWIQYVQKKYITDDTDRMWVEQDKEDDRITWHSYRNRTYGYEYDPDIDEAYKEMVDRDKRKWDAADTDKDGKLTKEEFTAFLHPEEVEHMKDIVVLETIEDIDKDKDGFISIEEYIADMSDEDDDDDDDEEDDGADEEWKESERDQFRFYRDRNGDGKLDPEEVKHWIIPEDYDNSQAEAKHLMMESDEDKVGLAVQTEMVATVYHRTTSNSDMWPNQNEEEPDWVKTEREQFGNYRDKNGDGKMDHEEVKNWIIPPNYDHSEAEAKHLIHESDLNKDGKLSKEEILEKYDIFVGSQATDFGEALTRHDEF